MLLPVERVVGGCHYSGIVKVGEGEQVVLRRKRLGWSQDDLGEAAGLSRSAVWKVEKAKNVEKHTYDAVIAALEKEESARGPGTTLSQPPATKEPSKEGADAAAIIAAARGKIAGIESMLHAALNDLRETLARLDAQPDQSKKQA